jgi:hypothetical protein
MIDDIALLRAQNDHLKRQLRLRESENRILRARIRHQAPVPQIGERELERQHQPNGERQ